MLLNLRLRMSESTDSSTSAARVVVKYDEVDGGRNSAIDKLLKSRKIKKSSKSRRIVKSQKTLKT